QPSPYRPYWTHDHRNSVLRHHEGEPRAARKERALPGIRDAGKPDGDRLGRDRTDLEQAGFPGARAAVAPLAFAPGGSRRVHGLRSDRRSEESARDMREQIGA